MNFLLQHWPNVRYRNGHSIVPGTIHPGTLLYHGTHLRTPPTNPEWVSFDPEQSYLSIYGPILQTHVVRAGGLKVLFFDGSSAAKMPYGTMDSQELIAYGNATERGWIQDYALIGKLCKWGTPLGLDGFVRVQIDFEMMVCDFSKTLSLVSVIDVLPTTTADSGPSEYPEAPSTTYRFPLPTVSFPPFQWPVREPPKGWKGSLRTIGSVSFEMAQAGIWRSTAPGLPGIELDYASAISLFDPRYRSLVEARRKISIREDYRAGWMSKDDVELMKADLETVLSREGKGSGVRWKDILRSVEERYADRLKALSALLNDAGKTFNLTSTIFHARNAILVMLTPYLDITSVPATFDSLDTTWLEPAIHRCKTTTTTRFKPPFFFLTPQEELIKHSVETVLREICQTLGVLWVDAFDAEAASTATQVTYVERWRSEVDQLMRWLGWAIWAKCDPPCSSMEVCSPPQWPFDLGLLRGWRGMDNYTPSCISRFGASVWRDIPDGM